MSTHPSILSLGRETPYQLLSLNQGLLVSYSDGLSLFSAQANTAFQVDLSSELTHNASALLVGPTSWSCVLASDQELVLYNHRLEVVSQVGVNQGESLIGLVAVDDCTFLCQDEAGAVTCWAVDSNLTQVGQWMVECTPLFSRGKTVVCSERGRLQERDARNGTVLRTWPNQASAIWGASDSAGHHALTVDEAGRASIWDLSSRELLFSFHTDFQVVRACFQASGLGGALLGIDGEVCHFRLTEGGATHNLVSPGATPVALCYHDSELLGLDENGGLWSLAETAPLSRGGEWAGWATCSCPLGDKLVIGTANGTLETFSTDGQHAGQSLALHSDAIIGLEPWDGGLLSISADASVVRVSPDQASREVARFPGRTMVDFALCHQSQKIYLALDEGLIVWLSLNEEERGEFQLEGRRVEEIRAAGPGQASVLTDRGSIKLLLT